MGVFDRAPFEYPEYWTRTMRAPSKDSHKDHPPAPEAAKKARETGESQYDNHGELHHPCGCCVGRNLLNEVPPKVPCPTHGEQP
jgi:hypothetical protein